MNHSSFASLSFLKKIDSFHQLINSHFIRVCFVDGSETYVVLNKHRGLVEPRKYRRLRLQQR